MTIQTIQTRPFAMNRLDRFTSETETQTFATQAEAIAAATEEVMWESTARATVTDKRTGKDIFDEAGSFVS
jgi:hypothetical protein